MREQWDRWESDERELNSICLFLPNRAGLSILKGMDTAATRRKDNRVLKREREWEEKSLSLSEVDEVIRSGAWLY